MKTTRTNRRIVAAGGIAVATAVLLSLMGSAPPSVADVSYSQNVQAVGETKVVRNWTSYGPQYFAAFCPPRSPTCAVTKWWRVSRGTSTARLTTFKVVERIKAYDYYLLDVDVTTSSRTGSGDGGTEQIAIHSGGPHLYDRNDSKSIDAKSSSCASFAVTMSTPWPFVTASSTVGHAMTCNKRADLTRTYSGADVVYRAHLLAKIRHLTMQRWVKVAAGKKPWFRVTTTLGADRCTKGDGHGHCIAYGNGSSARSTTISTSG